MMKIKYSVSNGEIICLGSMPDLTAGTGEEVKDVSFDIPQDGIENYTFNGTELVRKNQSVIDKRVNENNFDIDLMTKRISEVIDDSRELDLAPYLGAIQSAAKAKNFTKMKALINGLVFKALATQEESEQIKNVILEQGIDLNNY